jgi:hypothetical protein
MFEKIYLPQMTEMGRNQALMVPLHQDTSPVADKIQQNLAVDFGAGQGRNHFVYSEETRTEIGLVAVAAVVAGNSSNFDFLEFCTKREKRL